MLKHSHVLRVGEVAGHLVIGGVASAEDDVTSKSTLVESYASEEY